MNIEVILSSLEYVVNGAMFWGAMGFTTAIGMFVGALLYDGELDQARKGLLSVLSYACMLLWVNFHRVNETLASKNFDFGNHPEYAPAGTITVIVVSIAWILGVLIGVFLFRRKYKGMHR